MWHYVDAATAPVGRLAARIAPLLLGKHKALYHPAADCGDFVLLHNARSLFLSGSKMLHKRYVHHTGHPGGLRSTSIRTLLATRPGEILRRAVAGMLPKNRLRPRRLLRLKIVDEPLGPAVPAPFLANAHRDYRTHAPARACSQ